MKTKTKTTWRKVKLGEVADIKMGQSPRSEFYNSRGEGLPFYQGVTDFGEKYPKKSIYCSQPTKIAEAGDVFFSVRAPVGNVNVAIEKSCIGRGVAALRMKNGNNDFLYFFLKNYERYFKNISGGTTYESINKDQIEDIELSIPEDPNEQKRIADVLSAFDEKIELNNKINQTLEQMAQAIFKEWFATPSKALAKKGKLPKDWEAVDAEKILIFEKGVEPGSNSYSITKKANFIPFYRVRDLEGKNGDTDVFINKEVANNKICKYNDVLISFDATVGRIKIGCSGAFSSGIRRVYSKDGFIKNSFIYFWLKTPYVQNTILEYSSGTTILHAGSSIEFLKILAINPKVRIDMGREARKHAVIEYHPDKWINAIIGEEKK